MGEVARCSADCESVSMCTGLQAAVSTPILATRFRYHVAYLAQAVMLTYSASHELKQTIGCLREAHPVKFPQR